MRSGQGRSAAIDLVSRTTLMAPYARSVTPARGYGAVPPLPSLPPGAFRPCPTLISRVLQPRWLPLTSTRRGAIAPTSPATHSTRSLAPGAILLVVGHHPGQLRKLQQASAFPVVTTPPDRPAASLARPSRSSPRQPSWSYTLLLCIGISNPRGNAESRREWLEWRGV